MTAKQVRIGVFDSGLGGLSVVRALWRLVPDAGIIYLADTAHVPYGGRPGDEIRSFAVEITQFLIGQGADIVVMACNMSSAFALDAARAEFPHTTVLGVLQAGARAAAGSNDPIGVLATQGTVASNQYEREIHLISPTARVTQTACPDFVPFVESGELTGPRVDEAAARYLAPSLAAGARSFVLGCTHYPFLIDALTAQAPDGVRFIDPGDELAIEIAEKLEGCMLAGDSRFILSSQSDTFRPVGSRFLGCPLPALELACWQQDGRLAAPEGSLIEKEFGFAKS